MKNDLKKALDTALSEMDWHGEEKTLEAIRMQRGQEDKPRIRRLPRRTLILIAALVTLLIASAVALGLNFSSQYLAERQAADAICAKYGLTGEMLDLFHSEREDTPQGWMFRFAMLSAHGTELGEYTATKKPDGSIEVSWSHDDADQALVASGDLSSPAWGPKQLERVLTAYHQQESNWSSVVNYGDLTMAEKAALDAPMLENPELGTLIHILPSEDDLSPVQAEEKARNDVQRKYGKSEETLSDYSAFIDFFLYGGADRKEYRVELRSDDLQSGFVVYIASPSGEITWCRYMGEDESEILPEGDLSLYPEAVKEYMNSDAFDLLNAEEKGEFAARLREAGLGNLLPEDYLVPMQGMILEADAIPLAREALLEVWPLQGNWESFFLLKTSLIQENDQPVWQVSWQPREPKNWHWQDFEKMGEYKVKLEGYSGHILSCDWSLAGVETENYTEHTWGQAAAYSAEMLPWIDSLLSEAQKVLDKYPENANLDEMTLVDQAAYDQLFRDAGFDWRQYSALLPSERDITQEEAAQLAADAIQSVYGATGSTLTRGESYHEGLLMRETSEGTIIRVWSIFYSSGYDVYMAEVNSETGEIHQIWHDDMSIGNG